MFPFIHKLNDIVHSAFLMEGGNYQNLILWR